MSQNDDKASMAQAAIQLGTELNKYQWDLLIAIGKRDDKAIDDLIKDPHFTALAVTSPGYILFAATQNDNTTVIDAMLKANAQISTSADVSGRTALHVAVHGNDLKMVRYLLDHGIDAFKVSRTYETALYDAVKGSKTDCAMAILQNLKMGGMLSLYIQWEEVLFQVRTRGFTSQEMIADEKDILLKIKKLASSVKSTPVLKAGN